MMWRDDDDDDDDGDGDGSGELLTSIYLAAS